MNEINDHLARVDRAEEDYSIARSVMCYKKPLYSEQKERTTGVFYAQANIS
jgi:hypothetical protein